MSLTKPHCLLIVYIKIPSQRNDPAVMKSSENEDEDAEFPSKLEFSLNGTPIAMEFAAHFVDSQPPVTESNKIVTLA